jgi:hypothetical protein
MNADAATGEMAEKPNWNIHWVLDKEVLLEHPLDLVWPIFRDIRKWYLEYDWQVVDGPAYEAAGGLEEGQTLKLRSSHPLPQIDGGEDINAPDHYMTKILTVSEWEIVSVLYGETNDWKHYTSFYVWRFAEAGSDTVFSVGSYGEAQLGAPLSDAQTEDYIQRLSSNWHRSWSTAVEGLEATLAGVGNSG